MPTPLDNVRYVSLESFKKDGGGVKTPIWIAGLDGKLVFITDNDSFKVKRIRRNPKVRLAECNGSGSKILGPWFDGTARLIEDPAEAKSAEAALAKKYGWQFKGFYWFSVLTRRANRRVFLEITLAG